MKSFTGIRTFAYKAGSSIWYNGRDIYANLGDAWDQYKANDMKAFGADIGKSLKLVVLGNPDESAKEESVEELQDNEIPIVEAQGHKLALLLI